MQHAIVLVPHLSFQCDTGVHTSIIHTTSTRTRVCMINDNRTLCRNLIWRFVVFPLQFIQGGAKRILENLKLFVPGTHWTESDRSPKKQDRLRSGALYTKITPTRKHPCFEEEVRKWGGIYAIYVTTPTRHMSTSRLLSVQWVPSRQTDRPTKKRSKSFLVPF